jgi:hypothetical protein
VTDDDQAYIERDMARLVDSMPLNTPGMEERGDLLARAAADVSAVG